MGRYISTTGTAGIVIRNVTTTYQAVVNDRILANSSAGAFTITLPLSTSLLDNDTIQIIDVGNSAGTNNITVDWSTLPPGFIPGAVNVVAINQFGCTSLPQAVDVHILNIFYSKSKLHQSY